MLANRVPLSFALYFPVIRKTLVRAVFQSKKRSDLILTVISIKRVRDNKTEICEIQKSCF